MGKPARKPIRQVSLATKPSRASGREAGHEANHALRGPANGRQASPNTLTHHTMKTITNTATAAALLYAAMSFPLVFIAIAILIAATRTR